MVINNPGGISIPGIGIGANVTNTPRTETIRKFVPKGRTMEGEPVIEESHSVYLNEQGVLMDETIVKAANCIGCGAQLKSDSEAASSCTHCHFILCQECKVNYKCADCGTQSHPQCGNKYEGRFLCFYCWLGAMRMPPETAEDGEVDEPRRW